MGAGLKNMQVKNFLNWHNYMHLYLSITAIRSTVTAVHKYIMNYCLQQLTKYI